MSNSDYIESVKKGVSFLSILEHLGWQHNRHKSTKRSLHYERGGERIYLYANLDSYHNGYYTDMFSNQSGDVIQFLIDKEEVKDFPEALKYLAAKAGLPEPSVDTEAVKERGPFKPYKQLKLSEGSYIVQKRHLSLTYLKQSLFVNAVFQTAKAYQTPEGELHATIFPYTANRKLVGQELRNAGFKHFVEESNISSGLWHSKAEYDQDFFIAESPIDALSYGQIHQIKEGVFWASGGSISKHQLVNFFHGYNNSRAKRIYLLGDNDLAGAKFNLKVLLDVLHQYHKLHYLIQKKGQELLLYTGLKQPYKQDVNVHPNYKVADNKESIHDIVNRLISDFRANFVQDIPKASDFNKDLELLS